MFSRFKRVITANLYRFCHYSNVTLCSLRVVTIENTRCLCCKLIPTLLVNRYRRSEKLFVSICMRVQQKQTSSSTTLKVEGKRFTETCTCTSLYCGTIQKSVILISFVVCQSSTVTGTGAHFPTKKTYFKLLCCW